MTKFHFSLQKVLDLRKHQENQKAVALKKAQAQLYEAADALQATKNQKHKAMQQEMGDTINLTLQRVHQDFIRQLSNQILRQSTELEMIKREVDTRRSELVKAVKDRKAVELLREKRLLEFKKEINRKAAIQENEVALRMATQTY